MALGEKVGEWTDHIVSQRVVPVQNGIPNIEITAQFNGRLLGADISGTMTYVAELRPGGTLHGLGQGVAITKDGDVLPMTGQGLGRPTGRGLGATWRGACYFQANNNKYARLNTTPLLFEFEVNEKGEGQGNFWEWK